MSAALTLLSIDSQGFFIFGQVVSCQCDSIQNLRLVTIWLYVQIIFLNEMRCHVVVVEEQIRLILERHFLVLFSGKYFSDDFEVSLK